VHPGETWDQNFAAIQTHTLAVRDLVAPNQPFGLGLRLSQKAAEDLSNEEVRKEFKHFLKDQNLYVFTINGFPYGAFHKTRVKEAVYAPDWQTQERIEYTIIMGNILADLLPEGVNGSISTVPGGYKATSNTPEARKKIAESLGKVAVAFEAIATNTGKQISLGLEPEPDCLIETTDEMMTFMAEDMPRYAVPVICASTQCSEIEAEQMIRMRIGLCLDTCHSAMQYEAAKESLQKAITAGITISKIQVSAALTARQPPVSSEQLQAFDDQVYLHQTRIREADGSITHYLDLPEALGEFQKHQHSEWRIHCHVPLDFKGNGELGTTGTDLTTDFFAYALQRGVEHFEIETYTFDVLPEALRKVGIVKSIANEFAWVMERLKS
jgi:hypothetical protein